jgi:hypothetical protein
MCAWREFQIVLTALCLLLVSPFSAFATSIVTVIGGESITIAADGVLIGTSTETGEPVRDSTCKIRCIHHLCFAASGRYGNKTIGYNIFELAGKELSRPGSVEEVSARFRAVIEPLVPKLVAVSEKETPQEYAEWLKGRPVLGYLFAGFGTLGEPLVVSGQAMIDTEGRTLPIRESVKRGRSGRIETVLLGWNQHIAAFLKGDSMWGDSAAKHPSQFAEKMVRIEIEASENAGRRDVGEPITIVRLTVETGFILESSGFCREN